MSEVVSEFSVSIDQVENYEFRVNFDETRLEPLIIDEPPPLGKDAGPSPSRVLASSIGTCLCASLLFCLAKSRLKVNDISATVKVQTIRNEQKRLRIGRAEVTITTDIAEEDRQKAKRCLGLFEKFCTVSQSIQDGIDIDVQVKGIEAD